MSAPPATKRITAGRKAVGIDLGTTFSAIAHIDNYGKPQILPNSESERITPSVILFDGSILSFKTRGTSFTTYRLRIRALSLVMKSVDKTKMHIRVRTQGEEIGLCWTILFAFFLDCTRGVVTRLRLTDA